MAKETTVKIKITDPSGIGYAGGKEYEVSPGEAKKLIEAGKAVEVETDIGKRPGKVEKATAKMTKVEKR